MHPRMSVYPTEQFPLLLQRSARNQLYLELENSREARHLKSTKQLFRAHGELDGVQIRELLIMDHTLDVQGKAMSLNTGNQSLWISGVTVPLQHCRQFTLMHFLVHSRGLSVQGGEMA